MKQTIRRGVFETNSSSVHSLTLCKTSDFDKWKSGEMLYSLYSDEFVPTKDVESSKIVSPEMFNDDNDEDWRDYVDAGGRYISYDTFIQYYEDECTYETFEKSSVIDGEKVTAFGYYGENY